MGGSTAAVSVTGVATLLTSIFWPSTLDSASPDGILAVEVAPTGQLLSDWPDGDVNCSFWNLNQLYAPSTCTPFSVSRIPAHVIAEATDRAVRCGAAHDVHCILAGEIGFAAPAAFVYDEDAGFKIVLAPRIVDPIDAPKGANVSLVRVQDPTGAAPNGLLRLAKQVEVEYLVTTSHRSERKVFEGSDAFCVQALRRSILSACWETLD